MSDTYFTTLEAMINRFMNYKPGSITLENITRLCQTMGLESFVDQVDTNISRLSIASKIIVIDIDYETNDGKVVDVKLVLASNFDKFNYFNGDTNILYNSLTKYRDLHEFHYNLRFLTLLDGHSNIQIESNITQFDLFEYYSLLPGYVQQYFSDNNIKLSVNANLNDRFGIFISEPDGSVIAKLTFATLQDHNYRYYEFKYCSEVKQWINESPESYASGIIMLIEFPGDMETYFALDNIPLNQLQVSLPIGEEREKPEPFVLKSYNPRIHVMDDFTTNLYPVKSLQISNENISLLLDVLKWCRWWHGVMVPISQILRQTIVENQNNTSISFTNSHSQISQHFLDVSHCRRFSNKSHHRASVSEASTHQDKHLQETTLSELMNSTAIEFDEDVLGENVIDLCVSENYVYLGLRDSCSYYDDPEEKWAEFIIKLKKLV